MTAAACPRRRTTPPRTIWRCSPAALVRDFPEYYPWFSIREFVWNNIKQQNRNGLLERDPSVDGMKTGHTDSAGYCLVTSAKRENMRLIAVVLGSSSIKGREDASAALVNYGFTFYETVNVKQRGTAVLKPRVYKAAEEYLSASDRRPTSISWCRAARPAASRPPRRSSGG